MMLKPMGSFEKLREQINGALSSSRAICTNFFLTQGEIDENHEQLYTMRWESGLYIFRRLEQYDRLYFYLTDSEHPISWNGDRPVAVEIPYRDRDISSKQAVQGFQSVGFELLFHRIRMTRRGGELEGDGNVIIAGREHSERVRELFASCFHPLAGCIPTEKELISELDAGHILTDEKRAGFLHFTENKTGTELRHLAVAKELRSCGIGSALVRKYLSSYGGKKSTVWVRDDNIPAIRTYEKFGYKPDGMKSAVLICYNH